MQFYYITIPENVVHAVDYMSINRCSSQLTHYCDVSGIDLYIVTACYRQEGNPCCAKDRPRIVGDEFPEPSRIHACQLNPNNVACGFLELIQSSWLRFGNVNPEQSYYQTRKAWKIPELSSYTPEYCLWANVGLILSRADSVGFWLAFHRCTRQYR